MGTATAPQQDPKFFYLRQASLATGHAYWKDPDEARLAVFASTLKEIEDAIHKAIGKNTITLDFAEKDLRGELNYMAEAIRTMREELQVKIPTPEATLTLIGGLLTKAIIQLNTAANLEPNAAPSLEKSYWDQYQACYSECADRLYEARIKIGNIGKDKLPGP